MPSGRSSRVGEHGPGKYVFVVLFFCLKFFLFDSRSEDRNAGLGIAAENCAGALGQGLAVGTWMAGLPCLLAKGLSHARIDEITCAPGEKPAESAR